MPAHHHSAYLVDPAAFQRLVLLSCCLLADAGHCYYCHRHPTTHPPWWQVFLAKLPAHPSTFLHRIRLRALRYPHSDGLVSRSSHAAVGGISNAPSGTACWSTYDTTGAEYASLARKHGTDPSYRSSLHSGYYLASLPRWAHLRHAEQQSNNPRKKGKNPPTHQPDIQTLSSVILHCS